MNSPAVSDDGHEAGLAELPLSHTWPLWDRSQHFELGHVLSSVITDVLDPGHVGELGIHHAGCWECDLTDDSLVWSGGVYDIFGLPRGVHIHRQEAVGFYSEESRAKMERLRAYSIRHRRGFTLDVEIGAAVADHRRMRLIAEPVCSAGRAIRLHGLKLII